jgi:hypothetical protein
MGMNNEPDWHSFFHHSSLFSVSLLNLCLFVCVDLLWVFAFLVDPVCSLLVEKKMTINSTGDCIAEDVC